MGPPLWKPFQRGAWHFGALRGQCVAFFGRCCDEIVLCRKWGFTLKSRYVVPRLGPWREGDIGGDSFLNWGIGEVDTLTSRQAMAVIMCTPPPARMWSLEAAVLYRLNARPGRSNLQPGASISNTENSATLAAAREDTPLLVVMTPDKATEAAVRAAFAPEITGLTNLAVATIAINGTSVSSSYPKGAWLNFGTKPIVQQCDIFQLCMRVHASPVQSATPAFQTYLGKKFPLLMIEPSFQAADQPLYPIADRRMRYGPTTEAGLDRRRDLLAAAVVAKMRSAKLEHRLNVSFHPVELDKRRCLLDAGYHPYGTSGNCYGTSSDGRYTLSNDYQLPPGNMSSLVVVVVGANHAATGNAADNQLLHGTQVVVNPEGLEGSAEFFLGSAATPPDAGLFAFAFAESCSGPRAAAFGPYCAPVTPQQAGAAGALLRLEAYLDDVSGTRPSYGLLHPLALVFTAEPAV